MIIASQFINQILTFNLFYFIICFFIENLVTNFYLITFNFILVYYSHTRFLLSLRQASQFPTRSLFLLGSMKLILGSYSCLEREYYNTRMIIFFFFFLIYCDVLFDRLYVSIYVSVLWACRPALTLDWSVILSPKFLLI